MALGKSTLSRLIAGLDMPTKGKIVIDDICTSSKKDIFKLRQTVNTVFQNPENQILFDNVYDELSFALHNLKYDDETIEKNIKSSLEKVGMIDYIHSSTQELSLGQKQKIAIASILSINPNIILFDEPTTMLDPLSKTNIHQIVSNLHKAEKKTIIYVTNVIDEILLSDRIIVLDNGEIKSDFNKKDLFNNIDLLINLGLKIPSLINLALEFRKKGIFFELEEFTEDELINKISNIVNNH